MSEGGIPSDLPRGWAWARLDEVAEVRLGRQRSPKNHTGTHMRPYLRAANVDWDGLKLDDVKSMNFTDEEADVYRLQKGDIILSEASGSASEVGKPAIWNNEIPDCCLQNTLIRVRSFGVNPQYILHFLRGEARRGAFVEHSRGVGIHHIGVARLAGWRVPVPPFIEQERIVSVIDQQLSRVRRLREELLRAERRTEALRRSLTKEAFAGRLTAQDISEESAGVLIARIRAEREAADATKRRRRRSVPRTVAGSKRREVPATGLPTPPAVVGDPVSSNAIQTALDMENPS